MSLPLLVAAMWTAFVALAHVERSQLVAELQERASHGSDQEAAVAVRQLARMPRPPLDFLVAAAASPSRDVADEARLAISDLMRRWQRQLKSGKVHPVQRQLDALAESLHRHAESFSPRDYMWLGRTTEKLIELSNRTSAEGRLELAMHCDKLLALTSEARLASKQPAPAGETADSAPANLDGAAPSPSVDLPESAFHSLPTSALDALLSADSVANRNSASITNSPRSATTDWQPRWSPPLATAPSSEANALEFRRRAAADMATNRSQRTTSSGEPVTTDNLLESIGLRQLMERWLKADGAVAADIERELRARGFAKLSPELVELLLSDRVADREKLVYAVTATPGIDAKAWLLLLAEDDDAGVRFAALSMMATSNDPALLEEALDVALHDRDPRVASLAERLRNRRASAGRR